MEYIVGIDLGTSNSTVCYAPLIEGTHPEMLQFEAGNLCPSLVYYNPKGTLSVGRAAGTHFRANDGLVNYMKRILGKKYADVSEVVKEGCKSTVVMGPKNYAAFRVRDRVLLPEEVFVEVVKHIHKTLELKLEGGDIKHVNVTVPANYNQEQLTLTKKMIEDGGFKDCEIELVPEPVAACISYDLGSAYDTGYFLVIDCGGGTSDVALVKLEEGGSFDPCDSVGNDVGGSLFDVRILGWLKDKYQEKFQAPLVPDAEDRRYEKALKLVLENCRTAKESLSSLCEVDIDLYDYFSKINRDGTMDDDDAVLVDNLFKMELEDLNQVLNHDVCEIIELINTILQRNHISKNDITRVLLVGGSSRVKLIETKVKEKFGANKVSLCLNPDECVSYGACLLYLKDVFFSNRLRYNIYNCEGRPIPENFRVLLPERREVPCSVTKNYTIPANNLGFFLDYIYQGKTPETAKRLVPLAVSGFEVNGEPVHVTYRISVNKEGIISYSVTEDGTGNVLIRDKVVAK